MSRARKRLQKTLEEVANNNGGMPVYFQPPSTIKLKYPCIIYNSAGYVQKQASNKRYYTYQRFDITFITKEPESTVHLDIADAVTFGSLGRDFRNENLYHHVVECAEII